MNEQLDYVGLVKKAQCGDQESLDRLAEQARERLAVFVYRLTLEDDLTQEIVQETMFEMCKILGKLREADRFWPWLYGIATNKLRRHHRTESTRKRAAEGKVSLGQGRTLKEAQDGLQTMVSQELKEIVASAMKKLKTRHRVVLVMRCYDGMSYSEIAESMGCSEFSTRMLFLRAKRSLQKQLSHNGFGKGSLLAALLIFGKMTAPSEAAAANISVTAATMKVGALAGTVGLVASKTTVVSLATAGVLAVGSVTVGPQLVDSFREGGQANGNHSNMAVNPGGLVSEGEEHWYYFPDGADKPMMMRIKSNSDGGAYSQYLQNEQANYFYHNNQVHMNNHRIYAGDLSVMRLPTDSPELTEFLSQVEGGRGNRKMQYVPNTGKGLLVIATRNAESGDNKFWVTRHSNVLDEDYFRCDWPGSVRKYNNCDKMHERGWTYFEVSGSVAGRNVSGVGLIPFVYDAYRQHRPWLRLRVEPNLEIVDAGQDAYIRKLGSTGGTAYESGSFFAGLGRPWMGLHTIDTVRRDAALRNIWFETERVGDGKARVTLDCGAIEIVYTIDLDNDLVDTIEFVGDNGSEGMLSFTYLQDVDSVGSEFTRPSRRGAYGSQQAGPGISWLVRLEDGSLK